MIGQEGVAATDLGGFLADSLTANSTGRQVQITYDNSASTCYATAVAVDNSSSNCYETAVAVGGTNGQCS